MANYFMQISLAQAAMPQKCRNKWGGIIVLGKNSFPRKKIDFCRKEVFCFTRQRILKREAFYRAKVSRWPRAMGLAVPSE